MFDTVLNTLVKACLKTFKRMQNLTTKLQFNGFPISERVASSCFWRRSHYCLFLERSTFYLFLLMFLACLNFKGFTHLSFVHALRKK